MAGENRRENRGKVIPCLPEGGEMGEGSLSGTKDGGLLQEGGGCVWITRVGEKERKKIRGREGAEQVSEKRGNAVGRQRGLEH